MKRTLYAKPVLFILILAMVMSGFGNIVSLGDDPVLVPVITVIPDTMSVEVGEAVLFSGENTTYTDQSALEKARFEWDFGDGYYLKYGYPNSNNAYSGMSAVHYYMSPGEFTVTMTVYIYGSFSSDGTPQGDPILQESTSVVINVEGTAPMEGFEMLCVPFESRLAQFITVKIPAEVYSDSTNKLVVTLTGSNYGSSVLLDKEELQAEEKFLLEQRNLPAGDYQLLAELKDSEGNVLSQWKEKFTKAYDGIPEVGINEWNAICINGDPTFITSAFTLHYGRLNDYSTEFNTLYQMGTNSSYAPEGWLSYINSAASKGWLAIGPGRGNYIGNRHQRNASLAEMKNYIDAAKDHDSMIIWDWSNGHYTGADIPRRVLPPVLAAWTYVTKKEDPQHPVMTSLDGLRYLPYYDTQAASVFDYRNSMVFGKKRNFFADILMMKAAHPLNNRKHTSLFNKDRGIIDLWVQSIKNFQDRNNNLVPVAVNLEVYHSNTDIPEPTSEQILMEAWLAAIHGAKMIDWQVSNSAQNTNQTNAMRQFTAAMATFDDIFLGPDVLNPVTDNSNERYNRVDTLTRKDGEYTYLFAARLTEPDPLPDETNHQPEPDLIATTFTVPGLQSGRADVLDEQGKVKNVLAVENGTFTDTFEKCDVRIYRIYEGDPNENYPPLLSPIGNKTITAGKNLSFTISADDPEGQELQYSATNLPEGASFDPESKAFNWIPQRNQVGEYSVTFTVTDGENTVEETVTIEVIVVELLRIEITKLPAKRSYYLGEELNLRGLEVTGIFADNSTEVLPITMDNISGFDSSEPETGQIVTITYEDKTATFTVDILKGEYDFVIENVSLSTGTSVTVQASVTPLIPGGGNAVVIFKLMQGDMVLGLYSGEQFIDKTVSFTVKFHGYSGDDYRVKIYVWDKLDGSIDNIGVDLAKPVDTNETIGRPYIKDGTLVGANGERLRGGTFWIYGWIPDKTEWALSDTPWEAAKNAGLNILRIACAYRPERPENYSIDEYENYLDQCKRMNERTL